MAERHFSVSSRALSETVIEARNKYGVYSPQRIAEITEATKGIVTFDANSQERGVAVQLLKPRGVEIDDSLVIVDNSPYCQDVGADQMTLRRMVLQRAIGNGRHPLIAFGENTPGEYGYDLYPDELARIEGGDFAPIAEQRAYALSELVGRDSRLLVTGYSFGQCVGQLLPRYVDVERLVVADGPNFEIRGQDAKASEKQLAKDFKGDGLDDLNQAILDSKMANLREIQGVKPDGRTTLQQLKGFARFWRASKMPVNRAIHAGMATDRGSEALMSVPHETFVVVGRAAKSKIMPQVAIDHLADSYLVDADGRLEGYGHGAGDNVPLWAEFVLQATLLDRINDDIAA